MNSQATDPRIECVGGSPAFNRAMAAKINQELGVGTAAAVVARPVKLAPRTLYIIARDIRNDWKNPYFGAVPYIQAMSSLSFIDDKYGMDDAKGIILYFLSNANAWRGPVAREIKKELKKIAGVK